MILASITAVGGRLPAPLFWFAAITLVLLGLGAGLSLRVGFAEPMHQSEGADAARRNQVTRAVPPPNIAKARDAPSGDVPARSIEDARERMGVAHGFDLHVVAAATGAPIGGAFVVRGIEPSDRAIDVAAAIARTDESGYARLADARNGEVFAVVADGFVSRTGTLVERGSDRVELVAGHELKVRCVDEAGRPVSDCVVIASGKGAYRSFGRYRSRRVLNPLWNGSRGLWSAVCDDNGLVQFSTLTDAPLSIVACHRAMCALSVPMYGLESAPESSAPNSLEIVMREMWGLVVRVPGDSEIVSHDWELVANSALQSKSSVRLEARLGCADAQMRRHGPRSFCFVHELPDGATPSLVRFEVECADASRWGGEWAIQPLRSVESPLRASQLNPAGRTCVRVIAGGRELRGFPVVLSAIDPDGDFGRHGRQYAKSGERIVAPSGRYLVEFEGDLMGRVDFPDHEFDVHAGRETETVVWLPDQLTPVTVDVALPVDRVRAAVVSFRFEHAGIPGGALELSYEPGEIPLTVWMLPGEVKISVTLPGESSLEQRVTIRDVEAPVEFDFARSQPGSAQNQNKNRRERTSAPTNR